MNESPWSKHEKEIAHHAFEAAYERECKAIAQEVRAMARDADDEDVLWGIEVYLGKKRRETSEKYDYRYSVLFFVFARLIREGWLKEEDLAGLSEEKLHEIRRIVGFASGER